MRGSCEKSKGVNGRALAAEVGFDYDSVIRAIEAEVRLAGFRKATSDIYQRGRL